MKDSPLASVVLFGFAAWMMSTCARLQDIATAADRAARAAERTAMQCTKGGSHDQSR